MFKCQICLSCLSSLTCLSVPCPGYPVCLVCPMCPRYPVCLMCPMCPGYPVCLVCPVCPGCPVINMESLMTMAMTTMMTILTIFTISIMMNWWLSNLFTRMLEVLWPDAHCRVDCSNWLSLLTQSLTQFVPFVGIELLGQPNLGYRKKTSPLSISGKNWNF